MDKHIPTDKHVFICGTTGTGKSFLAENYLSTYDYVVKLDTKAETDERKRFGLSAWSGLVEGEDFTIVRDIKDLDECETDKIIFVPDYEEQTDELFDTFFKWCFLRENTIVWIDELMSVANSYRCPKNLGRIYQQGRSKNVAIWACSQRPSGVPVIATSNSTYFFTFDLGSADDRKRLVRDTGCEQLETMPTGYNFWYYKIGDKRAVKARLVM